MQVPQDPIWALQNNIHLCRSCLQYLPVARFHQSLNGQALNNCYECNSLNNEAVERCDNHRYRAMLDALRSSEIAYADSSRAAWFVQVR